jgi:hypothetical protein
MTRAPAPHAPSPLSWRSNGSHLRTSTLREGSYRLVSHNGVDWKAEWVARGGRPESIAFRLPEADCRKACDRHNVLRHTHAALVAAGDEGLVAPELEGDALAWKRPRRF